MSLRYTFEIDHKDGDTEEGERQFLRDVMSHVYHRGDPKEFRIWKNGDPFARLVNIEGRFVLVPFPPVKQTA